jgi:hypothetical protein
VVADREHATIRRVDPRDQRHVAEDVRVAGEVELEALLELEDDSARLPQVEEAVLAEPAARVVGVRQGRLDPVPLDGAALVVGLGHVLAESLRREPAAELDLGVRRTVELLRERDRVADVVGVPWVRKIASTAPAPALLGQVGFPFRKGSM